ncbi:winged helix DNA-binding domain-containing protein [Actinoplanes bogorensis]|uniref:Winged helix DNA-binding domain-containing protein n=1 Tax=Paractinoplanes bogorensis TaxID=1610840 RepID=A0ABS5Z0A8_9ACTN|nr:winged helix DNA-binding domain-containing protein [Actinoplanes bogorensis]MBU2667830.1 winged helix DNA-binding domain-containing protein [Actinoplanes bogorensis]
MELSLNQVRSWRLRRQYLDRPSGVSAEQIVERLCGVQAQVASAAEQAIAVRMASPAVGVAARALESRTLVKVWAMRGTLHLLPAGAAADYLSLLAAARTWEKGVWQKTFATVDQVNEIAGAAREILHDTVLTREELAARILERTRDDSLTELLGSGWGTVLKPLAWQGVLCNGPSDGTRVTYTSPATWIDGWTGLPEPDEAAARVIPAYLGAYGPATMDIFDQWLIRGASRKAMLKKWFAAAGLAEVTVDGRKAYARTEDLDDLANAEPMPGVRLLPAFDQFVLGPGTGNEEIVPPGRRPLISKAGGWIAPVVVHDGKVAGVWESGDDGIAVTLFPEAGAVSEQELAAEAAHLGTTVGAVARAPEA